MCDCALYLKLYGVIVINAVPLPLSHCDRPTRILIDSVRGRGMTQVIDIGTCTCVSRTRQRQVGGQVNLLNAPVAMPIGAYEPVHQYVTL